MKLAAQALGDANALKCELAGEVLHSWGVLRLRVTGWSMLPTVMPGDTLVIERISAGTVSAGDIVLFVHDRRLFVHRVVTKSLGENAILTCGDAMPIADSPVPGSNLLGKVSFIVRNGKCIEPARSPRFSDRAVSALVRRSTFAARVVVGVHGMRSDRQSPLPTP